MADDEATDAEKQEGIYRLRNIRVEEVSLVDRAANQRKFLIVKRSSDMPNEPGSQTPAAMRMHKATKDGVLKLVSSALDGLSKLADAIKGAEVAADGALPEAATKAVASAKDMLAKVSTVKPDASPEVTPLVTDLGGAKLTDALKAAALAPIVTAVEGLIAMADLVKGAEDADDAVAVPAEVTAKLTEVQTALDKFAKPAEAPAATPAPAAEGVDKAGRPMAKERLERFRGALKTLTSMLTELEGASDKDKSKAKKSDTTPAPAAAPAVPDAALAQLTEGLTALSTSMVTLATQVKNMTDAQEQLLKANQTLNQTVAAQGQRLDRIGKAAGVPASLPVESSGKNGGEDEHVSWPMDMNRPVTKATTKAEKWL